MSFLASVGFLFLKAFMASSVILIFRFRQSPTSLFSTYHILFGSVRNRGNLSNALFVVEEISFYLLIGFDRRVPCIWLGASFWAVLAFPH